MQGLTFRVFFPLTRRFQQASPGNSFFLKTWAAGCLRGQPARPPSLRPGSLSASQLPKLERKEFVIFAASSKHRPRGPGGINYKNLMNKIPQTPFEPPVHLLHLHLLVRLHLLHQVRSFSHSFTHSRSLNLPLPLTCQVSLSLSLLALLPRSLQVGWSQIGGRTGDKPRILFVWGCLVVVVVCRCWPSPCLLWMSCWLWTWRRAPRPSSPSTSGSEGAAPTCEARPGRCQAQSPTPPSCPGGITMDPALAKRPGKTARWSCTHRLCSVTLSVVATTSSSSAMLTPPRASPSPPTRGPLPLRSSTTRRSPRPKPGELCSALLLLLFFAPFPFSFSRFCDGLWQVMWGCWLGLAEFLGNTTVGVGGFCFLCGSFDSSPNVVSHDELL